MEKRVLLAFSGGIDSTYAAQKLMAQGYRVTGLTLDTCGCEETIENARAKASSLGIEFISLNVVDIFTGHVKNYFLDGYLTGITPAPCTLCNRYVKWASLMEIADLMGFDHIATGHYFSVSEYNGRKYISRPADKTKDQSYYLWMLTGDMIHRALTPMADAIKKDITSELPADASKKESMGICFLGGTGVREYLLKYSGEGTIRPGKIIDKNGSVISAHEGFPLYTIGQKKGTGLPAGMCIAFIDPFTNTLVAGYDDELYYNELIISDCNFADTDEILSSDHITVMIRGFGRNPQGSCKITTEGGQKYRISLTDPAWAPAIGQPVVLYIGDRVVGGGFLEGYTKCSR